MPNVQEPSTASRTQFSEEILEEILIELDGWTLVNNDETTEDNEELFINIEDAETIGKIDSNKKITLEEVEHFYNKSFNEALTDTNRYDINDLSSKLQDFFIDGVIKLTASNLWIKYNTSVTVNNEEGIIDYGQGGKLYKKYKKIISRFVRSQLTGLHSL
ncbi:MAG: hypothetical protein LBU40_03880 [Methanobrevibacter sp.]|jgi:hypothetical protein|nr:hypothetical protein [Methanobrevibacter sp.]